MEGIYLQCRPCGHIISLEEFVYLRAKPDIIYGKCPRCKLDYTSQVNDERAYQMTSFGTPIYELRINGQLKRKDIPIIKEFLSYMIETYDLETMAQMPPIDEMMLFVTRGDHERRRTD